jgi:hypothetical protein
MSRRIGIDYKRGSIRVALAALVIVGCFGSCIAEDGTTHSGTTVMLGKTGIASLDHYANGRALVTLENLRPAERISPRAERSMIPADIHDYHRRDVELQLPFGTSVEDPRREGAPLISIEDARRTVHFMDDDRGPYVTAGYFLPTASEPGRRPWMRVCCDSGVAIAAEFEVRSAAGEAQGVVLREVAAMDAKQVYFLADGNDGSVRLVVAEYSISRLPDRLSP